MIYKTAKWKSCFLCSIDLAAYRNFRSSNDNGIDQETITELPFITVIIILPLMLIDRFLFVWSFRTFLFYMLCSRFRCREPFELVALLDIISKLVAHHNFIEQIAFHQHELMAFTTHHCEIISIHKHLNNLNNIFSATGVSKISYCLYIRTHYNILRINSKKFLSDMI